jgi:hypothetical protein
MNGRRIFYSALILLAVLLLVPAAAVSAHGNTTVGDYKFVIGFKNEPALQGEPNALDLRVTNVKTNTPVKGLESTLQAELIFGASKKAMPVKAVYGTDGSYTAYVLPTETGDYTWHIFGKVADTPVDFTMTSSPTTFASVEAQSEISFPASQSSISALQEEVAAARQLATIGLIAGGLGVLTGLGGLAFALSRGRKAADAYLTKAAAR